MLTRRVVKSYYFLQYLKILLRITLVTNKLIIFRITQVPHPFQYHYLQFALSSWSDEINEMCLFLVYRVCDNKNLAE